MTALVPAAAVCPACGSPDVTRLTLEQLPLPLLHGGYGHGTAYTYTVCHTCHHSHLTATDATRPPRR